MSIHDKDRQLYTIQDLLDWKPPSIQRIISDGVLNIQNRMFIFGDEGSWKSMLALHTAHCLARGSRWLHFKTTRCNVLKIQVELPMYMDRARVDKYCIASKKIFLSKYEPAGPTPNDLDNYENDAINYAYPTNVINRTEQYFNINEKFGYESLKKNMDLCITELPDAPLVIILDPLYKMFNRDLSSATDVKEMIDKIDIICHEFSATFIIIHHTRKAVFNESGEAVPQGSQDAFGSRDLMKWADTILRVDPAQNDSTKTRIDMYFTKHRNAERLLPEFSVRWDRDTLHPQILSSKVPIDPAEEEELGLRGDIDYSRLE